MTGWQLIFAFSSAQVPIFRVPLPLVHDFLSGYFDTSPALLRGVPDLAKLLAARAAAASSNSSTSSSSSRHHSHIKALISVPRLDGRKLGVLATRSPHRPVPIGLSTAQVCGCGQLLGAGGDCGVVFADVERVCLTKVHIQLYHVVLGNLAQQVLGILPTGLPGSRWPRIFSMSTSWLLLPRPRFHHNTK